MKKVYALCVSALIGGVALTGCNNEYSITNSPPDAVKQYLNIAVSVPESGLLTRTVDEDDVNSIDIFFFNQDDGKLANALHYDIGNNVQPSGGDKGKTWPGGVVGTSNGDKYIVAGINLSNAMVARMKSLTCKPDELVLFEHTLAELTEGSRGMVMFSSTAEPLGVNQFVGKEEDAREMTPYVINVDRSVAKMAVFKDNGMIVEGGGEYENLVFGWANVNKKLSYIPKITISGTDPYEWADLEKYTPEPVVPVYEKNATPTVFAYAQENLLPYADGVEDKLTCLRITGNYLPKKFSFLDGDKISQNNNPYQTAVTFYTLESEDGDVYYFDDKANAREVLDAAGNGTVPDFRTDVGENGILTYTNGVCYFDALINNSASGGKKHNIARNTYYKITVNSIKAPGQPGNGTDPGPEPGRNQWIRFSVKVLDWAEVEEGIGID